MRDLGQQPDPHGGARLPVVRRETATPDQGAVGEAIVAARGRPGGPIPATFGVLLHSPEAARAVASLGEYCRYRSTLADAVREAAILSVAHALGADYERIHHEPLARRAGLDDAQLEALAAGNLAAPSLSPQVALAARVARHVAAGGGDDAPVIADSRALFGDAATVELVITAGYYTMLAAAQRVLGVTVVDDPSDPGTAAGTVQR
jgi:4-carboxymuconolactone decarboxylase